MLVSLQTHPTCFPEPVLELANKFIQERELKLIIFQGAVPHLIKKHCYDLDLRDKMKAYSCIK